MTRTSIRRNIQQIGHCVAEALSVVEHGALEENPDEPIEQAVADLEQAQALLASVLPKLRKLM